jgi:hypothetical protein
MNTFRRSIAVLTLSAGALSGCVSDSPLSPAMSPEPSLSARAATSTAGVYDLSFYTNGLVPVATLTVGTTELILKAHVASTLGVPAQKGTVTFEYCSLKGLPSNDITRADEAPSSACADGTASWTRLMSVAVNASGDAYMDFGIVRIPRTVGFRFRYASQGSAVASGTSAPQDFTWLAAP